jgi:hypothetical protein
MILTRRMIRHSSSRRAQSYAKTDKENLEHLDDPDQTDDSPYILS